MLRIALSTLRGRKGGMLGAFAAVVPRRHARRFLRHPARLQPAAPRSRSSGSPAAGVVVQASPTISGGEASVAPVRADAAAGRARRAPGRHPGRPSRRRRPLVLRCRSRRARSSSGRDDGRCRPRLVQRRAHPSRLVSGRAPGAATRSSLSADSLARRRPPRRPDRIVTAARGERHRRRHRRLPPGHRPDARGADLLPRRRRRDASPAPAAEPT